MKEKLAVQMFTLRNHTASAEELRSSFQRIAAMGYRAVQLSGIKCMNGENPEVSGPMVKEMMDEVGLSCIATHRPWDALVENLDEEIAYHKIIDCDFAAIGGIPQHSYESTYDGYRKWLEDAQPVIEGLKKEGIRFGHHNHSREFFRPERHGKSLEDVLIDEGGPDLYMELDLYWIAHAGVNPERILERCHGRVPVIHLKDKEALPETNDCIIAAIGEGGMDWKNIIAACEAAGVDWYAIEQDTCPRDEFDCLQSSWDYLSAKRYEG